MIGQIWSLIGIIASFGALVLVICVVIAFVGWAISELVEFIKDLF